MELLIIFVTLKIIFNPIKLILHYYMIFKTLNVNTNFVYLFMS